MNLIRFSISRSLLMNLLTLLIILLGLIKAWKMQREAFPSVNFDIVSIGTTYSGASPKEVETYVTNPIERELKGVSGIDESNSVSIEGLSIIIIKLSPDLSEGDKRTAIDDIQRAVDRASDLPSDLQNPPLVEEITSGKVPIIEVAISGAVGYEKLHHVVDELTDRIENIKGISKVEQKGFREKEFWVEVSPEKLRRYNLSLLNIVSSLAARNINLPGGLIETQSGEVLVRTIGEVETAAEIENVVLRSNDYGVSVRIKDVGRVSPSFEDEKQKYRTNKLPSINLNVTKTRAGDIISLVDEVKQVTDNYLTSIKANKIRATYVNDLSVFVRNRLGILLTNGGFGIVLVLCSLLLFLSPGIALVTALGMPVAFLGTIAIMGYAGMTINLITMFALVIVLGMLVDDAIIVAENIWQHYEMGEGPLDAAIKGTNEVIWPVTATILTSIAAFSPLLMVSGIFGKFIQHMPMVVIIALSVSLLEAMLVLPSHAFEALKFHSKNRFGRKEAEQASNPSNRLDKLLTIYAKILTQALRARWILITAFVILFSISIKFAIDVMPKVMFPPEGVEIFFVQADLPVKFSLEQTAEKFKVIEDLVRKHLLQSELKDFVTTIGKQQVDPNDPFTQRGSHLGQVQVFLSPESERDRRAIDIINDLRKLLKDPVEQAGFTNLIFERVRNGPPVGKPVAIRARGDNLEELTLVADKIMKKLEKVSGVYDISKNFRPGKDELLVTIDNQATSSSLLTVDDVAKHIRAAFAGQIASFVRAADERIAIRVRYPEKEREKIQSLDNIRIINAQGNLIKLSDVASIDRGAGVNAVFHRDYRRTVTVTAQVDEKITTSEWANQQLARNIDDLVSDHPEVKISAGGEWEETNESYTSLFESFVVAICLIYLILATQFSSLTQPIVVMAAIPFGIIGVIWAFFLHAIPLSFLGFIGMIGLTGVIVNDSIVLVDFINKAIDKGMQPFEAAIYAGKRRFRAVWLTTLTTVLGLLPLVYGIGGMDKFLQPAAVALGYGLIFGTVLVLFFVPAVYLIRVDIISLFSRKKAS